MCEMTGDTYSYIRCSPTSRHQKKFSLLLVANIHVHAQSYQRGVHRILRDLREPITMAKKQKIIRFL